MIKKFQLGAVSFKVRKVSDNGSSNSRLGTSYSPLGMVEVHETYDGKPVPEDSQEQTLFHEVVHAIFDMVGRTELSQDEPLVQSFSLLMHQFFRTMK